ncbi:MAG TPA: serine/threonine-protein kinase, partial [Verrucomicrobiae bacterium]|nr:serine/threonine-protein kinase [Verrucomicrobiae bacterium]
MRFHIKFGGQFKPVDDGPAARFLAVPKPPIPAPSPRTMSRNPSPLHGLSLDGLLAEGLRESAVAAPVNWEPPAPGDLQGAVPGYEILRLIGRGGMGAVYEARQVDLDRRVAIKLLPAELSANAAFAARFEREARTMGRLKHPNILPVFEFGHTTAGHLYFSMEYVEGGDLGARLKRGPLVPAEALRLAVQICSALATAHAQGVIHRDIKPSNILLSPDGTAKVADFGLAALMDRPPE